LLALSLLQLRAEDTEDTLLLNKEKYKKRMGQVVHRDTEDMKIYLQDVQRLLHNPQIIEDVSNSLSYCQKGVIFRKYVTFKPRFYLFITP